MIPVVLSGGSGTRLWPVSRAAHPKQFVDLLGEPLLRRTLRRVAALGEPWVLAVEEQRHLTLKVLRELGMPPEHALFEPMGRNTAPAVALLVTLFERRGLGGEVVALFPADHWLEDEAELAEVCALGEACAHDGDVVTLGIRPSFPATGYGYIEVERVVDRRLGSHESRRVRQFREKPDRATAEDFLRQGGFYWNAGMFLFEVEVMAEAFARHMPTLWQGLTRLDADLGNLAEVYATLPAQSLDYGVMEHLERQVTIPCDLGWSDVGSWDEVARLAAPEGAVFTAGAEGNFVLPRPGKVYGLVDVADLIVVDTADALLVARRESSQKVKELLEEIRAAGHPAATEHVYEHRPWGSLEILREGPGFTSTLLTIDPGQGLPSRRYRHRSRHWVIVAGHPIVELEGEARHHGPGRSVLVPPGARHRLFNPGPERVEIVEVETGMHLGEDDSERDEDDQHLD
ncbi:MAG TPA: sugar phosphate nucleotidyltransferase [Thermoanaerobaculia bacterium]|nr:sugar phosphate nucleotidyltransferase [Thermoanaerobaculia bacterium]